jgi:hypothetical protein
MSVVTDTTNAVSAVFGADNQLEADRQTLLTWQTDTLADIADVTATIQDQASTLVGSYGETTPPLVIDADNNVSVLNWPNDPVILAPLNDAYAAAIAAVVAPIFEALGDSETAYLLNQRAEAGPAWPGSQPNPWTP